MEKKNTYVNNNPFTEVVIVWNRFEVHHSSERVGGRSVLVLAAEFRQRPKNKKKNGIKNRYKILTLEILSLKWKCLQRRAALAFLKPRTNHHLRFFTRLNDVTDVKASGWLKLIRFDWRVPEKKCSAACTARGENFPRLKKNKSYPINIKREISGKPFKN